MGASKTLDSVRVHIAAGRVRISEHGRHELSDDSIRLLPMIEGVAGAVVVEDYPNYVKGPCVLWIAVLQPHLLRRDG